MKKFFSFFASILFAYTCLFAQNVGIGDPLPSAKLTISGSETTPNGQAASLKIRNTASSNTWFLRTGATGTNTPANGFSIGDNVTNHFNMLSNGNLGLGLIPQSARLHVNGAIKMEGTNFFEFGAGIAGKELNAGKIGYNAFGSSALEIVGAGTTSTNRRVYFFAEGGTHFGGPVNVSGNLNTVGQLQLNDNPGVAGQVITSNGSSAPTWKNQAFTNNTRFGFNIPSAAYDAPITYNTIYNLNPADVTVSGSTITINKSGLYHFEGSIDFVITFSGVAPLYTAQTLFFYADDQNYVVSNHASLDFDINLTWRKNQRFQYEIYVTAPANIRIDNNISLAPAPGTLYVSSATSGKFSGYLISE